MAVIKGLVALPALGTLTQTLVDTNISADSRYGWQIEGFKGTYLSENATGVETPEAFRIDLTLSTKATVITTPDDEDEIARVDWDLFYSAAGMASIGLAKQAVVLEPRLTVQPILYVTGYCPVGLASVSNLYFEISYSVVKLTDVELLRLLIGGA